MCNTIARRPLYFQKGLLSWPKTVQHPLCVRWCNFINIIRDNASKKAFGTFFFLVLVQPTKDTAELETPRNWNVILSSEPLLLTYETTWPILPRQLLLLPTSKYVLLGLARICTRSPCRTTGNNPNFFLCDFGLVLRVCDKWQRELDVLRV